VLADRVSPGQATVAIGVIKLPEASGTYRLKLDLILEEIADFPALDGSGYGVNLVVQKADT
jgi:hypothetical protein